MKRAVPKQKPTEVGIVEIRQVRPGCEVETDVTRQRFVLLYKTAGSALVGFKKKVGCFGGTALVDRTQRVSLGTPVKVITNAPENFDPDNFLESMDKVAAKGEKKRAEPGADRPAKRAEVKGYTPEELADGQNARDLFKDPYEMVESLLVGRGLAAKAEEVYAQVKAAFPDYKGSKDSIASKKSHLKKAGRLS